MNYIVELRRLSRVLFYFFFFLSSLPSAQKLATESSSFPVLFLLLRGGVGHGCESMRIWLGQSREAHRSSLKRLPRSSKRSWDRWYLANLVESGFHILGLSSFTFWLNQFKWNGHFWSSHRRVVVSKLVVIDQLLLNKWVRASLCVQNFRPFFHV